MRASPSQLLLRRDGVRSDEKAEFRRKRKSNFQLEDEEVGMESEGFEKEEKWREDRKTECKYEEKKGKRQQGLLWHSPPHNNTREKALKVLGVSENDVEMSLRFFVPRRYIYGSHFPATRHVVIRQALHFYFKENFNGIMAFILEYDRPIAMKPASVSEKALRVLGTKSDGFRRHKALRILGETNHEIEEVNAKCLARLGLSTNGYKAMRNETDSGLSVLWCMLLPLAAVPFTMIQCC
mmetsp:Transcript_2709/g.3921  ORF Transcript_2709/g.3921 Transcript_2709/m.3921 type:complete len:238 (-) Transcript_2709:165-878(-)